MPYRRMLTRVPRTFVPPEAKAIAEELRSIAAETRAMGAKLGLGAKPLDELLEGLFDQSAFQGLQPIAQNTGALAEWVEAQARRIETTQVTVWEDVWEEVWVPDEPDQKP
jgi:hypothetical protein